MNTIPYEITEAIFLLCPISGKRCWIRTCKQYYEFMRLMPEIEKEFQKMINDSEYLTDVKFTGFSNPCYKYTVELVYDKCYQLIPDIYFNERNKILFQYDKIHFDVGLGGNLKMIEKLLVLNSDSIRQILRGAVGGGHLEILEWAEENGHRLNDFIVHNASGDSFFKAVMWLSNNGYAFDQNCICELAAQVGDISMLKKIINKKKYKWDKDTLCAAAYYDHIDILKWLYRKDPTKFCLEVAESAAHGGHIHILEFLFKNNIQIVSCSLVAKKGHIHVLKWLKENGHFGDNILDGKNICKEAVSEGHFEILKWAKENGCELKNSICDEAVKYGNLEILKWLRKNGCKLDKYVCQNAAENGHLEVLKWARKHGCKWGTRTCINAATNGHLEVLQWARKHGCEWDQEVCDVAAENGHFEVLKWAVENDCDYGRDTVCSAAFGGHLDILKWLLKMDCDLKEDAYYAAAQNGHLDVLEWIHLHSIYRLNESVSRGAVKGNQLGILKWALANGCGWDTYVYEKAMKCKNKKIKKIMEAKKDEYEVMKKEEE